MNELSFSAKTYGDNDICTLAECELSASCTVVSGSGAADEPYVMDVSVTNTGNTAWKGIIRIECGVDEAEEPFFLLPGFMVGTNRGDAPLLVDSKCARLRKGEEDFPASPFWFVRADRLSHPVALIYANNRIKGLSGDVRTDYNAAMQYGGFGCDMIGKVYYTIGWENAPWLFTDSHTYSKEELKEEQCVCINAGATISTKLTVYDYEAESVLSLHDAVRKTYSLFHETPRKGETVSSGAEMLSRAMDEYGWIEDKRSYSCFVFDYGNGYETRMLPSISWTNGMSVAAPLLAASHRLAVPEMRRHALAFIDRVVTESLNEASGLPWESYSEDGWSNHGWWFDRLPVPGHTGYITGQAMYYILKSYEAEKLFENIEHTEWLSFAQNVLDKTEKALNGDYEFPYVFSEKTGAGSCYDSMGGAWCLAACACERLVSGRRDGMELLLKSEQHYYDAFVSKVCCYGGPFDIDKQIDSEGVLAYLRAVRCLHELTGEEYLLKHMKDALDYEFTFKFCYNSPVRIKPLNKGWSSCGGSITSVTNPHIHPMSSSVVDELLYYCRQTGDEYVLSRLKDTVRWGLQTFNRCDGEYGYGKTGWMSERYCYSQGLLTEHYSDGSLSSTWLALMPWAAGSVLEGLCGMLWDDSEMQEYINKDR